MRLRHGRSQNSRGASAIEFAITLPLLVMLLFGIITGGQAYNLNNSMNNATREATRYGTTLPVDGNLTTWLNDVADVARAAATGAMDPAVDGQQICVAYVYPDGTDAQDQTKSIVEVNGVRTVFNGTACWVDSRPSDERRIQVSLERDAQLEAVLYSSTLDLEATSIARYERSEDG